MVLMAEGLENVYANHGSKALVGYATEDLIVQETDQDGRMVEPKNLNPPRQRGVGGGATAWTRGEFD